MLDEVALYDPDNEESPDGAPVDLPGSSASQEEQLIAVSSLWTIQEESEPEPDA